ncbi:hypothetical protein PPERSA_07739 [Pseudocohnilembus persalinus]|uniref:Uncharacterized protein n=1 Tax=Pseudocohnilembus persalinus TaxID=266149 RepID=A0A0V0R9S7_PSEPJ|nr:hypothetical protein PPERSA_07739 [Pseudocohnilembus persalinus]|eukprot:KRX11214.1 hypothetical protein PPERSA_07739 [Pseudocohnilembus persalinus]
MDKAKQCGLQFNQNEGKMKEGEYLQSIIIIQPMNQYPQNNNNNMSKERQNQENYIRLFQQQQKNVPILQKKLSRQKYRQKFSDKKESNKNQNNEQNNQILNNLQQQNNKHDRMTLRRNYIQFNHQNHGEQLNCQVNERA